MPSVYPSRINEFSQQLASSKRQSLNLGFLRLFVFLLMGFAMYWMWGKTYIVLSVFGIGLVAFVRLVMAHQKMQNKITFLKEILQVNQNEIDAAKGDTSAMEDGTEFIDHQHDYSHDLDLFGNNTFFPFINRTVSIWGKRILARSLATPELQKQVILDKQKAVQELTLKLDWRQEFLANGAINRLEEGDQKRMTEWHLNKQVVGESKLYLFLLYALPVVAFSLLGLAILNIISWAHFGYFLLVPLFWVGRHLKQINAQYNALTNLLPKLEVLAKLTEKIEEESFDSVLLQKWQKELLKDGEPASVKIHGLRKLLDKFEQRSNMLMGILLNALLLWDLNLMRKMELWKQHNALELNHWLNVIGNFDATISVANMTYNHKNWVYPQISDQEFEIVGKDLKHPLLDPKEGVGNDYGITGKGSVNIITGANMAGKSTFLRTIGLNMVLGMMGAPLSVAEFTFSPMRIFSSMRTEDSLAAHTSFFYAELSRLARVSDILKSGEKTFVILDEILKGTNSVDKARGSYAFVEKMIRYNMMGIIATHDLSLCELSDKHPNEISNKSFEVEFVNDDLVFDYTLRDRVCQNMNASFLLKKMGIVDHY